MKVNISTTIYHPRYKLKGAILIIHGMSEHRKRYHAFARYLSDKGYGVITYDQIGHGESVNDESELGYFGKKKGYESLVYYAYKLSLETKNIFKDVPFYVFGHSMGSIIARSLLKKHSEIIDGVILSGPPFYQSAVKGGMALAKLLSVIKGDKERSQILRNLTLGVYEKAVKSDVKNAWLSFNEENVKKYNEDELCGFNFTNKGYYDMLSGLVDMHDVKGYKVTNPMLPILIIAGKEDPAIGKDKGLNITVNDLRRAGYDNIEVKLYENSRHEVLLDNEYKLVYDDVIEYLNKIV
ncbi:MAG TPA: hypothetical protein DHS57_08195 [Erysipelotrichaceae bacterium]|nr:hypothetical protein [Erysipelotrichaceae bacterium]